MGSRDEAETGEQVVVVFLESSSTDAVQVVTEALGRRGFDVYPATADESGPTARFDYERARFLVAVLTGEPTAIGRRAAEQRPVSSLVEPATSGIKVLLFPGSPIVTDSPDLFYLAWDPDETWLDRLIGAVRLLNPG